MSKHTSGGHLGCPPRGAFKRWVMFAVGVLLVVGVIAAAPALERVPGLGSGIEALRASGIESGAFWYRDVPKVRDAEFHMRGVRDYFSREGD